MKIKTVITPIGKLESGIEESKFKKYFTRKNEGYAIKIRKIRKYEIPKELEEFSIKVAPQSFQYLYEQEDNNGVKKWKIK